MFAADKVESMVEVDGNKVLRKVFIFGELPLHQVLPHTTLVFFYKLVFPSLANLCALPSLAKWLGLLRLSIVVAACRMD